MTVPVRSGGRRLRPGLSIGRRVAALAAGLMVVAACRQPVAEPVVTSRGPGAPAPGVEHRFPDLGADWARSRERLEAAARTTVAGDPRHVPRMIRLDARLASARVTGTPQRAAAAGAVLDPELSIRSSVAAASGRRNLVWEFRDLGIDARRAALVEVSVAGRPSAGGGLVLRWAHDAGISQPYDEHTNALRVPLEYRERATYRLELDEDIHADATLTHLAIVLSEQDGDDSARLESVRILPPDHRYHTRVAGMCYERIGDHRRSAVFQWSQTTLELEVPLPATAATLQFGTGLLGASEPAVFSVKLAEGDRWAEVFRHQNEQQDPWSDHRVDLGRWRGRTVRLRFEVASTAPAVALWASPRVVLRGNQRKVLLVYLIDALRADHVQGGGSVGAPATPCMQNLAKRGVRFTRTLANAPLTQFSVPALMTGLLPYNTGVLTYRKVPGSVPTLAEWLRREGFLCASFLHNSNAGYHSNLHRGFDQVASPGAFPDHGPAGSRDARSRALHAQLASFFDHHPDEDLFIYVHTLETHMPYIPDVDHRAGFEACLTAAGSSPPADDAALRKGLVGWERNDPNWIRWPTECVVELYRGAVQTADRNLGRVVQLMAERTLLDTALIVVTADHGEHLFEHPEARVFTHNAPMYMSTLHVPLILIAPGHLPAGVEVETPAQLVDLAPTLLDLLAIRYDSEALDGSSLVALASGADDPWFSVRPVISQVQTEWAVLGGGYLTPDIEQTPLDVFDVIADPSCLSPLGPAADEQRRLLRASLRLSPLRGLPAVTDVSVSWERDTVDQLRELGYIQ